MTAAADDDVWAPGWDVEPVSPPAASSGKALHRKQVRMAYRLAERYVDRLLFVGGIGWHVWDGHRWAEDDRGEAQRAVLAVLEHALTESLNDKDLRADVRSCETGPGIRGVLEVAAVLEPFVATVADLDADPYLLNCANGTLDLRTMRLRNHNPADRITKVARAAYRPEQIGSTWPAFLDRVLPDVEVRGFLQRLAGVGLLGRVIEHVLAIATGSGANGKSTWHKALGWALGDYAATAEPDLFMHREGQHPTGEFDLRGVRWVTVSESDKDRRLAEATMKRLTGGDPIRARRMRQDFVEFQPSHTAVLITNHLPKVSGDDPAIWRRLRVIPFNVTIPADEQDVHLDEQLQLDADAVLTWAIEGYCQYTETGLAEPAAVRAATDSYHQRSDAIARFIDERCLLSPHMHATTGQLFDAWCKWAGLDGAEPMSRKTFGQALDAKGYPAGPGGRAGRQRQGIGIAAEDEDEDA